MSNTAFVRVTVTLALALILATAVLAQSQASLTPGGIPELLAEVRALRAEVNQAAGASMRMQLLLGRLTLQEQRVAAAGRELLAVQSSLSAAMRERSETESEMSRLKNEPFATYMPFAANMPPEVRREMQLAVQQQLTVLKDQLQRQAAREQELRTQESELLAVVSAEQGRWMDFNARLDELERSLPTSSR